MNIRNCNASDFSHKDTDFLKIIYNIIIKKDFLFFVCWALNTTLGFPGGSMGKESACNAGDTGDVGSIPGLGRSPGEGHGNPFQYSCLENPMDRGLVGYSL